MKNFFSKILWAVQNYLPAKKCKVWLAILMMGCAFGTAQAQNITFPLCSPDWDHNNGTPVSSSCSAGIRTITSTGLGHYRMGGEVTGRMSRTYLVVRLKGTPGDESSIKFVNGHTSSDNSNSGLVTMSTVLATNSPTTLSTSEFRDFYLINANIGYKNNQDYDFSVHLDKAMTIYIESVYWTNTAPTPLCTAPSAVSISNSGASTYEQGATSVTAFTSNVTGGSGTITRQWYVNSVNSTTGGTAISGQTGTTFTPPVDAAAVGTKYYYMMGIADGACPTASNIIAITVNAGCGYEPVCGTTTYNHCLSDDILDQYTDWGLEQREAGLMCRQSIGAGDNSRWFKYTLNPPCPGVYKVTLHYTSGENRTRQTSIRPASSSTYAQSLVQFNTINNGWGNQVTVVGSANMTFNGSTTFYFFPGEYVRPTRLELTWIAPCTSPTAQTNAGSDKNAYTNIDVELGATALGAGYTGEWTVISQPLGSNYTFSSTTAPDANFQADMAGTYTLRWKVTTSTGGCIACDEMDVTVTTVPCLDPPTGGSTTGGTIVLHGTNSTLLGLTGYDGTVVRWQYSTDGGTSWTPIASSAFYNYLAEDLTQTTQFRAEITKGFGCANQFSTPTTITIDPTSIDPDAGANCAPIVNYCTGPVIVKTTIAPTIGGTIDAIWSTAKATPIANQFEGAVTRAGAIYSGAPSGYVGQWRALYDDNYVYFLIESYEVEPKQIGSGDWWQGSGVDIITKKVGAASNTRKQNCLHYTKNQYPNACGNARNENDVNGGTRIDGNNRFVNNVQDANNQVLHETNLGGTTTGFSWEIRVSWANLGITKTEAETDGIDMEVTVSTHKIGGNYGCGGAPNSEWTQRDGYYRSIGTNTTASSDNYIWDGKDLKNVSFVPTCDVTTADLIITDVDYTFNCGNEFIINCVDVKNIGTAVLPANTPVKVKFNVNGHYYTETVNTTGVIAINGTEQLCFAVGLTITDPGTYNIEIDVNSDRSIPELRCDNNTFPISDIILMEPRDIKIVIRGYEHNGDGWAYNGTYHIWWWDNKCGNNGDWVQMTTSECQNSTDITDKYVHTYTFSDVVYPINITVSHTGSWINNPTGCKTAEYYNIKTSMCFDITHGYNSYSEHLMTDFDCSSTPCTKVITGTEQPQQTEKDIIIYSHNSQIFVVGTENFTVYNITGKEVQNRNLLSGVYIVKIGNKAYKAIVK